MIKVIGMLDQIRINADDNRIIKYARSKNELAFLLVSEKDADCLVMEYADISQSDKEFINSVRQNFTMIDTAVVSPSIYGNSFNIIQDTGAFKFIPIDGSDIDASIENFITGSKSENKRGSNRFCWPLTAEFSIDNSEASRLAIYSISSGGAYLESSKLIPPAGKEAFLKINFKNSQIATKCVINDYYSRSSKYPFGFSVSFTSLSDQAKLALDRMVDDAIIRILLDPHTEPDVPSLDSDMLSIDSFSL